MNKKNKRNDEFDNFWNFGFDNIFREFEERMNQLMANFTNFDEDVNRYNPGGPITYGYSIKIGPETNYQPEVRQWGNLNEFRKAHGLPEIKFPFFDNNALPGVVQQSAESKNDPYVDIIDQENKIQVIVEVPGFDKKDLTIEIDDEGKTIYLNGKNENKEIKKTINLTSPIKVKSIKSSLKNGVLEIIADKKPTKEQKNKHRIKIE